MKLRIFAFLFCLLGVPVAAQAQAQGQQQGYPMTPTGTRFDAAQGGQNATPAINAQSTLTIPAAPSGQSTYITTWYGAQCEDGTVSTINVQQNWTSTNMPALGAQTSTAGGATLGSEITTCDRFGYTFPTGYKSSCQSCVVTLVSPAALAHVSFPQLVTYYYAP